MPLTQAKAVDLDEVEERIDEILFSIRESDELADLRKCLREARRIVMKHQLGGA
jgi:hypothetical protein